MFAAQAVIRAKSPPLHQREDPVNPRQHEMRRHLADDTRVMPVVAQSGIGSVAVGQQRGPRFHSGPHESFNRCGGIIRDHGQADAAGPGIEVFGSLALWLGLIRVAIDHLNGPGNEDFPSVAGIKEAVAGTKGDFRLINFNHPFEGVSVRIDHRSPQLLCQQPGGPIGKAKLILQLPRRHSIGMRRHQMRGPKPNRQRQLGAMQRRARCDRGLPATVGAFISVRPALQRRRATIAARRETKPPGQRRSNKNPAQLASSGNAL